MLASLNHFFSWMNWQELRVRFFRIQEEIYEREERELTKKEYEKLLREARRKGTGGWKCSFRRSGLQESVFPSCRILQFRP